MSSDSTNVKIRNGTVALISPVHKQADSHYQLFGKSVYFRGLYKDINKNLNNLMKKWDLLYESPKNIFSF